MYIYRFYIYIIDYIYVDMYIYIYRIIARNTRDHINVLSVLFGAKYIASIHHLDKYCHTSPDLFLVFLSLPCLFSLAFTCFVSSTLRFVSSTASLPWKKPSHNQGLACIESSVTRRCSIRQRDCRWSEPPFKGDIQTPYAMRDHGGMASFK